MELNPIFKALDLIVEKTVPLPGGNINNTCCIQCQDHKRFLLKTNEAGLYPNMLAKEAHGLNALRAGSPLSVPAVIAHGVQDTTQYLLLEWIEKGTEGGSSCHNFGKKLAYQHRLSQPTFGFTEDNYMGTLVQTNTNTQCWSTFYTLYRILPLVRLLNNSRGLSSRDVRQAEKFCHILPDIFPEEPPALLHGDLWSGNYLIDINGAAFVFDPAVHYGHREMDIGMTRLFGGFPDSFYSGYQEVYPLQAGWQARLPATQLYPLLVHAVLFGEHYIKAAKDIIRCF